MKLSAWFQSQTPSQLEEEEEKKGDFGMGLIHPFVHNGPHWDFWIWTQVSMKCGSFNIQAPDLVWIYFCALNCLCPSLLEDYPTCTHFLNLKSELKMWPTVSFVLKFQFSTETRSGVCMFQNFGHFRWQLELVGSKDKEVQTRTCLNGHGCHLPSFLDAKCQLCEMSF